MREAAKNFEFERAAALRDRIRSLKQRDLGAIFSATVLNVDPAASYVNVQPAADSPALPAPATPNQPAPVSNLSAPASNPQTQEVDAAATAASAPIEPKSPKPAAKRRAR